MILFIIFIFCIGSTFGMDKFSETSNSNIKKELDLTEYTKQKLEIDDVYDNYQSILSNEDSGLKILSQKSEDEFNKNNKLKRKHKTNKKFACEFCHKESTKYEKSEVNDKSLCKTCRLDERTYDYFKPLNERKKRKNNILVCELCQKESTQYTKSKYNGKFLCYSCYTYESHEYLYGHLVPSNERTKHKKHKNILVCEVCKKESNKFIKGQISGKSLCHLCYMYESHEYLYGHLKI